MPGPGPVTASGKSAEAAGTVWRRAASMASGPGALPGILLVVVGGAVAGARWAMHREDVLRGWWARLLDRPAAVGIRRRCAALIDSVQERVDPRGVYGLLLTLGLALTLGAAWALGAVLQALVAHEELVLVDLPVERFVAARRAPLVGDLMHALALAGEPWVLVAAAVAGVVAAVRRAATVRPGIYLLGTMLGGFALERVLHALVGRVGLLKHVALAAGGSFPSGHLVTAVSVYGSLAFVVARVGRSWKAAVRGWVSAGVVLILVAAGRVYLGDHLASGVVAAGMLGATWLAVASAAWLVWDRLEDHPHLRQARNRMVGSTLRWGIAVVTLGVVGHVLLLALPGIRRSAATLEHANLALVVPALLLEAASVACLGQLYRRSLAPLGATVPYREAERIALGMFTVSRVVPVGGPAAVVWGAKELTVLGVDPAIAMTSLVLAGLMAMATLCGIVLVGAVASLGLGDISAEYAAGVVLAFAVLTLVAVVARGAARSEAVRDRVFDRLERVLRLLRTKIELGTWREAAASVARGLRGKGTVRAIVQWSVANWLLDVAALYLLFVAFHHHVHLGVVVVGLGVANLVAALPLTPGGIGLVEAGLAGTFTAFGTPASISVVVVLAYRLLSFWLPVLAGIPISLGAGRPPPPHPQESDLTTPSNPA